MPNTNTFELGSHRVVENWDWFNIVDEASDALGARWLSDETTSVTAWTIEGSEPFVAETELDATDDHISALGYRSLQFRGKDGSLYLAVRFKMSEVTHAAFNIGFFSALPTVTTDLPISLSGTTFTLTTASTTFIGFVYDADATNVNIHACWADAGTLTGSAIADLRFSGLVPKNDVFYTYVVKLNESQDTAGNSLGLVATMSVIMDDGTKLAEKRFPLIAGPGAIYTISSATFLAPYIGVANRTASARKAWVGTIVMERSLPADSEAYS